MPYMVEDPFDTEDVVWMIQRRGRNGWWTLTDTVRRTRSASIRAFEELWIDGPKQWRRQRDAGHVRCVWGPLYSKSK